MRLDITNFFRYFIFDPRSTELNQRDKDIATISSLAIGIATLGICHAVCYLFFYDRTCTTGATSSTAKKVEKLVPGIMPASVSTPPTAPKRVPNDYVLDFYRGKGSDIEGRTLKTILDFSLEKKESQHDYIQWLFPIDAPSRFNSRAPVVDKALIKEMKQDPQITDNMKRSFHSMLEFYGLYYDEEKHEVATLPSFQTRATVWLTPGNHNFSRISRMLHSLRIMGLDTEAKAFFDCLDKLKDTHPECWESINHWRQAARI